MVCILKPSWVCYFSGKARKKALRETFLFSKSFQKTWKECFSFREKHIRDGFNVTFSLVRKSNQKRRFFCYFLRRAKSNQKHAEGLCPLDSRGTVQNSDRGSYLLNRKLCAYQKIFAENHRFVQYSSEYFEPVRGGYFTTQGFSIFYKKAGSDLGGQ